MEKKVLTAEEITQELEIRKKIRRQRLEERVIDVCMEYEKEDVIHVLSLLINRITK